MSVHSLADRWPRSTWPGAPETSATTSARRCPQAAAALLRIQTRVPATDSPGHRECRHRESSSVLRDMACGSSLSAPLCSCGQIWSRPRRIVIVRLCSVISNYFRSAQGRVEGQRSHRGALATGQEISPRSGSCRPWAQRLQERRLADQSRRARKRPRATVAAAKFSWIAP